jgi:hypothetical protein
MNVFGHYHVPVNAHVEATPHVLQTKREQIVNRGIAEIGLATITTEGDEVRLSGLVIPPQAERHEEPTLPLSKYSRA